MKFRTFHMLGSSIRNKTNRNKDQRPLEENLPPELRELVNPAPEEQPEKVEEGEDTLNNYVQEIAT